MSEKYEDYRPNDKSATPPSSLKIAELTDGDLDDVAEIYSEREGIIFEDALENLKSEQKHWGKNSIVFTARVENEIAGYGRARYLNTEQGAFKFEAPNGWYFLGTVISPKYRRMGIATELSLHRFDYLSHKCQDVFSFCNAQNRTSIAYHLNCGFKEIKRADGFWLVPFDNDEGILFCKRLKYD